MTLISVLVPSRLKELPRSARKQYFFERAVASMRRQTVVASGSVRLQIILGVDVDADVPTDLIRNLGLEVVASGGKSQAAALNAAAARIEGDYVAILEDDDEWEPSFLEIALSKLASSEFVSSSQVEYTAEGSLRRIVDYPTPSGWVMPRSSWKQVGLFNEEYRWHLDSEWLGRLNELGISRVHLVEASAPDSASLGRSSLADLLPWRRKEKRRRQGLLRIAALRNVQLDRHGFDMPLVRRVAHDSSGHAMIQGDPSSRLRSGQEKTWLEARFGTLPW